MNASTASERRRGGRVATGQALRTPAAHPRAPGNYDPARGDASAIRASCSASDASVRLSRRTAPRRDWHQRRAILVSARPASVHLPHGLFEGVLQFIRQRPAEIVMVSEISIDGSRPPGARRTGCVPSWCDYQSPSPAFRPALRCRQRPAVHRRAPPSAQPSPELLVSQNFWSIAVPPCSSAAGCAGYRALVVLLMEEKGRRCDG